MARGLTLFPKTAFVTSIILVGQSNRLFIINVEEYNLSRNEESESSS